MGKRSIDEILRFTKMGSAEKKAFVKEQQEKERADYAARMCAREADEEDLNGSDIDSNVNSEMTSEVVKGAIVEKEEPEEVELPTDERKEVLSQTRNDQAYKKKKEVTVDNEVSAEEIFKKARQEHNIIYIDTVWDTTLSGTKIFKALYNIYERCIYKIKHSKYSNVTVKLGLTYLNTEVHTVRFKNGTFFTEDGDEFINALLDMEFKGGSFDGREDFNEALADGIRKVINHSEEHAGRGVIFFTDSLPHDVQPDFMNLEGCIENRTLRFMVGYAESSRYAVQCNIGDKDNNATANGRNVGASIMSIQDLFQNGGETVMLEMVEEIMKQMSVNY